MKLVPVLKTERLVLRGINESDTDFIVDLRENPEIYRFFTSPHKISREEHLFWFQKSYLKDFNRIEWIGIDGMKIPVGIFGIRRSTKISIDAEISYILSPNEYGKGYASEAVTRLIEYCRVEWDTEVLTAEIHINNYKSLRFIQRMGFEEKSRDGCFMHFERQILADVETRTR